MSPLGFMQRLAALVPRPHLIRHHGLALNAKLPALVVPREPAAQEHDTQAAAAESEAGASQGRPHRISWARLFKRVFEIGMQHCPNFGGGAMKIIAAILERSVIEKILEHLAEAGTGPLERSRAVDCRPKTDPLRAIVG